MEGKMRKSLAMLLLLAAGNAMATDVTTLQAVLESARQQMMDAKAQYEASQKERSNQEKAVSRLQAELVKQKKRLAEDIASEKAASESYAQAKKNHDHAQAILDRAWSGK